MNEPGIAGSAIGRDERGGRRGRVRRGSLRCARVPPDDLRVVIVRRSGDLRGVDALPASPADLIGTLLILLNHSRLVRCALGWDHSWGSGRRDLAGIGRVGRPAGWPDAVRGALRVHRRRRGDAGRRRHRRGHWHSVGNRAAWVAHPRWRRRPWWWSGSSWAGGTRRATLRDHLVEVGRVYAGGSDDLRARSIHQRVTHRSSSSHRSSHGGRRGSRHREIDAHLCHLRGRRRHHRGSRWRRAGHLVRCAHDGRPHRAGRSARGRRTSRRSSHDADWGTHRGRRSSSRDGWSGGGAWGSHHHRGSAAHHRGSAGRRRAWDHRGWARAGRVEPASSRGRGTCFVFDGMMGRTGQPRGPTIGERAGA